MTLFDKQWFQKHQKVILLFANSFIGRTIFGISRKIKAMEPQAILWEEGDKDVWEFLTFPKYAKDLKNKLKPLWAGFHLWDFFADKFLPSLSFGFATYNPDIDPESTTFDGVVLYNGGGTNWTDVRAHDGNAKEDAFLITYRGGIFDINAGFSAGTWNWCTRNIYGFDTSSLGTAPIDSASVSIYGTAVDNYNNNNPAGCIVGVTVASNTAISNVDYSNFGSTLLSSVILIDNWNTSGYNNFVLNSNGLSYINTDSPTFFGAREYKFDFLNTSPSWNGGGSMDFNGYHADTAPDSSGYPKLTVTLASRRGRTSVNFI